MTYQPSSRSYWASILMTLVAYPPILELCHGIFPNSQTPTAYSDVFIGIMAKVPSHIIMLFTWNEPTYVCHIFVFSFRSIDDLMPHAAAQPIYL